MIKNKTNQSFPFETDTSFESLKEKERYLDIINDFSIHLIHQETRSEIAWAIAKRVIAKMGFLDCIVYLMAEDKHSLVQVAAHVPKNPMEMTILKPITIQVGDGIVGNVAKTGIPQIINDTRKDERYIIDDDFRLSEIAVPIIFKNEVLGVIDSEHPSPGFYTENHLAILNTIAAIAASRLMHAKTIEELKYHKLELEKKVHIQTAELKLNIQHLAKSNRDLESFAYAASHDLKEPLRTIISYLQLLNRNEPDLKGDSRLYLDFVLKGSRRMNSLLDGLMNYSSMSGKSEVKEPINTNEILLVVNYNLKKTIEEKNATIVIPDLPNVKGNKTQILQLFQNLISNGIKFSDEQTDPVIEIKYKIKQQRVVFGVADNGIGIKKDFYEKIFDLFSKLNTIDKYKGSGIGLALCKKIVNNHAGLIQIESTLGQGTTFSFDLPIAA